MLRNAALCAVQINAYLHVNGQNRLRQRTYTVDHHVRYGYDFQPIIRHPADSRCAGGRWWGAGCGALGGGGALMAVRAGADGAAPAPLAPSPAVCRALPPPPHLFMRPSTSAVVSACPSPPRRDRKPRVRWAHFHDIVAVPEPVLAATMPSRDDLGLPPAGGGAAADAAASKLHSLFEREWVCG